MSYQLDSVSSVLTYINAANSTTFKVGDLAFSNPQVVSGTWREEAAEENTAVRVSGEAAAQLQGRQIILYDRLDLGSLIHLAGFQLFATGATTVHDILDNLNQYTGTKLSVDDVEDTPLTTDGEGKVQAVISAKPNSLGWIGSVQLEVKPGGIGIDQAIAVPDLPGLNYPTALDTDTYGAVYTYGYDFTQIFDTMIAIENGVLPSGTADALVTYLKAVDVSSGAALWNNDSGQTTWSLNGATVTHSGLNDPVNMPTNPAYKYVVALTLRNDVTTPAGTLYLHFNDPFDPDDF